MPIRIAIAGIGNCASSLVQGIQFYSRPENGTAGLQHPQIGPWRVADLKTVAAFDVDARKVGRPLEEAIFALPNNTKEFCRPVEPSGVTIQMGPILDGFHAHMKDYLPHH